MSLYIEKYRRPEPSEKILYLNKDQNVSCIKLTTCIIFSLSVSVIMDSASLTLSTHVK